MRGGGHCDMSSRSSFNERPVTPLLGVPVAKHRCQPLQESPQLHRVASPDITPFPGGPQPVADP